jgi:hypothetical protein
MSTSGERVGRNEAVFREVNERIKELSNQFQVTEPAGIVEFICECSAETCRQMLEASIAEYERVRTDPSHFLIVPGHIWHPEHEREILRTERYAVIEKRGDAEEEAVEAAAG